MKSFRSSLIIQTKTKKELKLPETVGMHTLPHAFALHPSQSHFYLFNDGIEVFTTDPINLIERIEYKKNVNQMVSYEDTLVMLNDTAIMIHGNDSFNLLNGDFTGCRLLRMHGYYGIADGSKKLIGLQSKNELKIYDFTFQLLNAYRCQCAYSGRHLLLLGDFNSLKVFTLSDHFEIKLPDNIKSIVTDGIFNKIYIAAQDTNIYVVSMAGEPLKTMNYHESEIRFMKLSICGKFLYSVDSNRICIWNTEDCVVIGYVDLEDEIMDFDLVVEGDKIFDRKIKLV